MSAILKEARTLANFLMSLDIHAHAKHFQPRTAYNHLGALLTDIILQPGLHYNNVVLPRVRRVHEEFHYATTTPLLKNILKVYGAGFFLNCKNEIKTRRLSDVLNFLELHKIEDENDFRQFLVIDQNKERFLTINGIGPKTADYALKLMGVQCVAVDRHLYSFVKKAGIDTCEYHEVKMIVEYAADLLALPRTEVDSFIWVSMSNKPGRQMSCSF